MYLFIGLVLILFTPLIYWLTIVMIKSWTDMIEDMRERW